MFIVLSLVQQQWLLKTVVVWCPMGGKKQNTVRRVFIILRSLRKNEKNENNPVKPINESTSIRCRTTRRRA